MEQLKNTIELDVTKITVAPQPKPTCDRDLVIQLWEQRIDYWSAQKDNHQELKRLVIGSVKRSKVVGLSRPLDTLDFFKQLSQAATIRHDITPMGASAPAYHMMQFQLPYGWKAFTPMARIRDLLPRGRIFANAIRPCEIRTAEGSQYFFHAPDHDPVMTDKVTFILKTDKSELTEWFAGIDPGMFLPSSDPGSMWVHLGVDLVAERINNQQNQRRKQNGKH